MKVPFSSFDSRQELPAALLLPMVVVQ